MEDSTIIYSLSDKIEKELKLIKDIYVQSSKSIYDRKEDGIFYKIIKNEKENNHFVNFYIDIHKNIGTTWFESSVDIGMWEEKNNSDGKVNCIISVGHYTLLDRKINSIDELSSEEQNRLLKLIDIFKKICDEDLHVKHIIYKGSIQVECENKERSYSINDMEYLSGLITRLSIGIYNNLEDIEDYHNLNIREKRFYCNTENNSNKNIQSEDINLLIKAAKEKDFKAALRLCKLILWDEIGIKELGKNIQKEEVQKFLFNLKVKGSKSAAQLLDDWCTYRYNKMIVEKYGDKIKEGTLKDFEGNEIKIDINSKYAPVKAKLEFVNGINILRLKVNYALIIPDKEKYVKVIKESIKEWEGEYKVFGNQKLKIIIDDIKEVNNVNGLIINVSSRNRISGTVFFSGLLFKMLRFIIITLYICFGIHILGKGVASTTINESVFVLFMSMLGVIFMYLSINLVPLVTVVISSRVIKKWSFNYSKACFIKEIKDLEFLKFYFKSCLKNAFGIGTLYYDEEKYLGVDKGIYPELDAYHISGKLYNLISSSVECGMISNNEIEMLVLALSKNEFQNYQLVNGKGKISEALGRGN